MTAFAASPKPAKALLSSIDRIPGRSFGLVQGAGRELDAGMGLAVGRRTVFRPEDQENFARVGRRVAEGNLSVVPHADEEAHIREFSYLANAIGSGALLTSGRHLQHGDALQHTRNMEVFTNCATAISSFAKFYLLLNGSGVGRAYDDELMAVDWSQAPTVGLYLSPDHKDYPKTREQLFRLGQQFEILPWGNKLEGFDQAAEDTVQGFLHLLTAVGNDRDAGNPDVVTFRVPDSREGWAQGMELLETMAYQGESHKTLVLDFSDVRPLGSPIGGMQGRPASGPLSLMRGIHNIWTQVIIPARAAAEAGTRRHSDIWADALRVDHYLSVEVQVGGARRAARMATKSWRDPGALAFVRIKSEGGLWTANHSLMVDQEFWDRVRAGKQGTPFQRSIFEGRSHKTALTSLSEAEDAALTAKAVELFEEATRCSFVNGEPGFINCDLLEDYRTGTAWQKPVSTDGGDFRSDRYQVAYAAELLTDLSTRAKNALYPVTTNPCVTSDAWVQTSEGPRQVRELLDAPFTAIVDGKPYQATAFWLTGEKQVFKLKTDRGYEVRATTNHKFLVMADGQQVWRELGDIKPSDVIVLANHRELGVSLERTAEFGQGWLLGQVVGNGGMDMHGRPYVRFWGDSREGMAAYAKSILDGIPATYHQPVQPVMPADQNGIMTIASKKLGELAEGRVDEAKTLLPGLEKSSEEFVRGFLAGFFDADGSVQGDCEKGTSVRLSQSDLPRLQAVQRMLARLGIASTIYPDRREAGMRQLPDGKGGMADYACKADHELVLSKDNIDRYADVIGFEHPEKSAALAAKLISRKRAAYKDSFTAKVVSITEDGFEPVYDCTVDVVHRFDANGIIAHNCGEIVLHVTGGYCVIADYAPLLACPVDYASLTPGLLEGGIAADWDQRVEDSVRLAVRFLMRANQMNALYGREVARTNRIGVGPTGLHEWAWVRYGLGFNDLIDEKRSAEFWAHMERLSKAAKDEARHYAKVLGVNVPVTVTTIKPAGTTSKLFGLTEGAHLPARRQYLRWVQFRGTRDGKGGWSEGSDPLLADYEAQGYPVRELQSFPGMSIVGFPTMPLIQRLGLGDRLVTAPEASPEQQYQYLRLLERYWIGAEQGNQVSYTLKLYTDQVDLPSFQKLVLENQPGIRCCSILPSKPDHELGYEYLPEEQVTEERFADIVAAIESRKQAGGGEDNEAIDMVHLQCAGGVCPI